MELFFSPELIKSDAQVLNIITNNNKAVGYLAFLMEEEKMKMYVYGQLEEEGVREDFKDLVKPYIQGLLKVNPDFEVYSYLSVGGTKVEFESEKE
ncbi:hypothetical protein QA612_19035 [Evansella sp. AB-P1]|uniref:hypothetical protein n=1 Tax=Evansella sp. AB-P1 TaxID=3037653 RepID=UPI00241C30F6|nr:hypothetical protein [Evansella sp. AB-P1]MDG5789558.1 hypothetical protein [Evansella sp. AB-P1]